MVKVTVNDRVKVRVPVEDGAPQDTAAKIVEVLDDGVLIVAPVDTTPAVELLDPEEEGISKAEKKRREKAQAKADKATQGSNEELPHASNSKEGETAWYALDPSETLVQDGQILTLDHKARPNVRIP